MFVRMLLLSFLLGTFGYLYETTVRGTVDILLTGRTFNVAALMLCLFFGCFQKFTTGHTSDASGTHRGTGKGGRTTCIRVGAMILETHLAIKGPATLFTGEKGGTLVSFLFEVVGTGLLEARSTMIRIAFTRMTTLVIIGVVTIGTDITASEETR